MTNVDVLKLGLRLIKIVEELHEIGIVHLDIKPDNILIGDVSDILHNYDIDVSEDKYYNSHEIAAYCNFIDKISLDHILEIQQR